MSADNWTICPRCKMIEEKKQADKIEKVKMSYGKVSADEYMAIRLEAEEEFVLEDTFREDYEIGLREGVFQVDYHGICVKCKYALKFKHEEIVGERREEKPNRN